MSITQEAGSRQTLLASGLVQSITHRTYARCGLFGNPSDQYGGRTIAFLLENFYAETTLTPSAAPSSAVRIQPHPVYDSTEYQSLQHLVSKTSTEGLYGGVRLLTAAVKRFVQHCATHNIPLRNPENGGGFTLSYETTVPRQTGLAGSSAMIYSALKCLMDWFSVDEKALPYSVHPQLVLSVEAGELGIAAGLQDRVVQVYGGAVYMDFDPSYMCTHGGVGRYSHIPTSQLPQPLHVMYSTHSASESGKVHSGVKSKWLAGDPKVRAMMVEVAECGDEGLRLLLLPPSESCSSDCNRRQGSSSSKGHQLQAPEQSASSGDGVQQLSREMALVALMNRNADLRRMLFGDEVLGTRNLRMLELARSVGAGVNFTGSGGAVVVFCPGGKRQVAELAAAAAAEGFSLEQVKLGPERAPLPQLLVSTGL